MRDELYAFRCKECDFIYLEPYNISDRFSKYPSCPDCGCKDVEIYEGELSEDLQEFASQYADELENEEDE
jgi:Zn finger protein HypA/HybF involved in hydrogenase expression